MPCWIIVDTLMKTSNQCMTGLKNQVKYQQFLVEEAENKIEHHYAPFHGSSTYSSASSASCFICFISNREECKKCSDRRNEKLELEQVQRRATSLRKFIEFFVKWDSGSL